MKQELRISPAFALPLDAATRRMAIVAMSGAGKSNLAVSLAEEMFDAGIPWVAIDPKGDWYGVRSDDKGKGAGLPVPVFGGLHGDVPLEPTAGRLMAELVVEHRLTCVLDVSEFLTRSDQFRFLTDFAETLLKKNRHPLHLFLEEADDYLPQSAGGGGSGRRVGNLADCLGAWQRLVKRGRFRGIGSTLITQRSAAINKDVLNMAECLFALRVTAPHDRKAVQGWVEINGLSKDIVDSLPTLADGEAWIWSPSWLKVAERVQMRRRRTFDSGKTPEMGKSIEPAKLASIDLNKIEKDITATRERAKEDDPTELRKRIRELEAKIAKMPHTEPATVIQGVPEHEVKRLLSEQAHTLVQRHEQSVAGMRAQLEAMVKAATEMAQYKLPPPMIIQGLSESDIKALQRSNMTTKPDAVVKPSEPAPAVSKPDTTVPVFNNGDATALPKSLTSVLGGLAFMEAAGMPSCTRPQLAAILGLSPKASTLGVYLGQLARAGYVASEAGRVSLTAEGRDLAPATVDIKSRADLHSEWMSKFSPSVGGVLKLLIESYPDAVTRHWLADQLCLSRTASTLGVYVSELTKRGIVSALGGGLVRANDILFPEGLQ